MKLKTTVVFKYMQEAYNQVYPIVVHQGSSRSSKTYNILIWIIFKCLSEWHNYTIDVGRKTFPSLRVSAMSDFFEILKAYDLYSENYHNKSDHIYMINGNTIRFFSVDQETKVRGAKRHILFMNEANEFTEDDFKQMNQRTTVMTILDYNPSDEFHWIYDKVLTRDDAKFYKTTFRENPFLDARVRKEIFSYKETDPNYWRIYGLGERGVSESTIFTHWTYCDKYEGEGQEFFGLDFGFNDPTALVRVKYHQAGIVADQLLFLTNLTSDLIISELDKLVAQGVMTKTSVIIADSARPEIIEDIRRAGYNVHSAKKEKGSVLRDINFMKRHKIAITATSVDMIKEFRNYKWKVDKTNRVLDDPVDLNNHSIDAVRYALNNVVMRKEYPTPTVGRGRIYGR